VSGPHDIPYRSPTTPDGRERRFFVHASIVVVCLVFLAMVATLLYRGMRYNLPQATFVIEGNEATIGDEVTIVTAGEKERIQPPKRIEAKHNYIVRFAVPPGSYIVLVNHRGTIIPSDPTPGEKYQIRYWPLKDRFPSPSTQPQATR
jgi:hypothetical protein